jgi:solute carrier family 25 carnitine/acylcarnitine transporter 20/29
MQTEQSNTRNAMAAVYKEFGVVGFFRGISSPLASSSLLTAATFSAYNVFKRGLGLKEHDEYDCRVFIAGAGAGLVCSLLGSPFELIKIQAQFLPSASGGKNSSTMHAVNYIYRNYGSKQFFAGYGINSVRQFVFLSVYFSVYEYLKHEMGVVPSSISWARIPLAGGIAGCSAWFISYPLDAIKVTNMITISFLRAFT